MNRYQKVIWRHELGDEPVALYSEIDATGAELRKVDEYRDGRLDVADHASETGTTQLSVSEMPSLDEINQQSEFSAQQIDAATFERIWITATSRSS